MEALQLGSVQMLAPSLAKFGPLGVREFEVFDLPYIFDNYDELHKVTEGPVGAALFKKLESKGIVGLAYWDNGFKVMSANKPIRVPADYKGLKMRIQSSKVLGDEMKALGAIPQVMAFSEVYQALQTGVVDGTENPPSNFYTQKMQEVQKYLALTDHGYLGYAVIANKKFWDGLPADVRTTLEGAMKDATKYANDIAQEGKRRRARSRAQERQDRDPDAHAGAEGGDEESAGGRAQGKRVARRQGHSSPRSTRKPASSPRALQVPALRAPGNRGSGASIREEHDDEVPGSPRGVADRVPDGRGDAAHLRRGAAPLRRRHADPRRAGRAAQDRPVLGAGALHLHVRVDGEVRRGLRRAHRHPRRRRRDDQPPAGRHAQGSTCCSGCWRAPRSPAIVGTLGATFMWDIAHTSSTSPDLEMPKWIVYLCIPLGSYLMCFRFLQVAWHFARTGELPHHDVAHVEGIEDAADINPYDMADNLHPAAVPREAGHEHPGRAGPRERAALAGADPAAPDRRFRSC